jgi:hypothetical protein
MEDENLIDFDEARPAGLHSLRLPAFWVDKPVSWFVLAESRFRLNSIHREQTRYDYLVSALTKEVVSLVLDVVEHPQVPSLLGSQIEPFGFSSVD